MNNQQIPGLVYPTVNGQLGNSQSQSAIIAANDSALKMNKMSNELAGGKKKRYRRGGSGNVVVPQFQMSYTPQNGPGQDPNAQIQQNASISTQAAANSVYDAQAVKMGGSNPDWVWGCSSGGASRGARRGAKKRRTPKRSSNKRKSHNNKKRRTFKRTRRHHKK